MEWYQKIVANILVVVSACSVLVTGCSKTKHEKLERERPEVELVAEFQETPSSVPTRRAVIRLSKDTVYVLRMDFTRESGEQLEVEAGTVIKSNPGLGIYIRKGGLLVANGEPSNPIVFTSNRPTGFNNNYWMGIVMEGDAPDNIGNPTADPNGNSGSLQYVRIEFGSLTCTNLGSGTTLNHVQTSYAGLRNAFTFSGGTMDAKYLFSYACGTAADFSISNGYRGKLQFIMAYRHPFFGQRSNDPDQVFSGVLIENNSIDPNAATPLTEPMISNMTVIGPELQNGSTQVYQDTAAPMQNSALVARNNAHFYIGNSLLSGFPGGGWTIADSNTAASVHHRVAFFLNSEVQTPDSQFAFFVRRGIYKPYDSTDFRVFMEREEFGNRVVAAIQEFGHRNLFRYENTAELGLLPGSRVIGRAKFDHPVFGQSFFEQVDFLGAMGEQNWLEGWGSLQPLKTNYNILE